MTWTKRALVSVATLVGSWMLAAGSLFFLSVLFEMLAWQPLHRGNYADAEPLLEVGASLGRAATWIRVPGQRIRLAGTLGDLGEARAQRGALAEAEELYLESIAIFEAELGADDSHTRHARWRYANFRRSTGRTGEAPGPAASDRGGVKDAGGERSGP